MNVEEQLARLAAGDESAMDVLLAHACERLRRLTRKMLHDFPGVQRWEQTDDVFNNALLRLCRAVRDVRPTTEEAFFRLAALNVRRELIDLARRHGGPMGHGANHASNAGAAPEVADPWPPERVARWREFHEQIDGLPDESRQVVDLLIYHGLTQSAAAARLGVTTRTVQNRFAAALRLLHQALGGEMPE